MTIGTTLLELRKQLRSEVGMGPSEDMAKGVKDAHNYLLNRMQKWLYEEFDWPAYTNRTDIALVAGTDLYDVSATNVNLDRIIEIHTKYGGQWCEVSPGIDLALYAEHDPDEDERSTPAKRWRRNGVQNVEVWPLPNVAGIVATKENYLRITSVAAYTNISADDDACILDDTLIVLYAASEILARKKDPDAQNKLALAKKRFNSLRGTASQKNVFRVGGADEPVARSHSKKELRVVSAPS